MTSAHLLGSLAAIVTGSIVGLVLGGAYFRHLQWSACKLTGRGSPFLAMAGMPVRLLAAAGVFLILARWNGLAVIAALAGFTIARQIVVAAGGGRS